MSQRLTTFAVDVSGMGFMLRLGFDLSFGKYFSELLPPRNITVARRACGGHKEACVPGMTKI